MSYQDRYYCTHFHPTNVGLAAVSLAVVDDLGLVAKRRPRADEQPHLLAIDVHICAELEHVIIHSLPRQQRGLTYEGGVRNVLARVCREESHAFGRISISE